MKEINNRLWLDTDLKLIIGETYSVKAAEDVHYTACLSTNVIYPRKQTTLLILVCNGITHVQLYNTSLTDLLIPSHHFRSLKI